MQDLMPILRSFRKHKTAALLIVLETALCCAIVANALHLVGERLHVLTRDDGLAATELLALYAAPSRPLSQADARSLTLRDQAALRAVPGVVSASFVDQLPYAGNNNFMGLSSDAENKRNFHTNTYAADLSFGQTLGLRYLEGGPITEPSVWITDALADIAIVPAQIVVNAELAQAAYPGQSALGKPLYLMGKPFTIRGVAANLPITSPQQKPEGQRFVALMAVQPATPEAFYAVRAAPGLSSEARSELVKRARAALLAVDAQRQVTQAEWLSDLRRNYDTGDRQMAWLMAGVTAILLLVTTGGVVGLMSFWVQQRTRMIGTRRALGATRGEVLRYFLAENALLTAMGIALGMLGAYGLSLALAQHWEVAPLPAWYLPAGAVLLLALGQAAVWGPARRAANLPPVAALRG